jgi:hypothetical protein
LLLHFAVERPFLRLRDYAIGRKPAAALKTEMRDKPAL